MASPDSQEIAQLLDPMVGLDERQRFFYERYGPPQDKRFPYARLGEFRAAEIDNMIREDSTLTWNDFEFVGQRDWGRNWGQLNTWRRLTEEEKKQRTRPGEEDMRILDRFFRERGF